MEIIVEKPVRKRTRAEREAETAEMVAKAAEEQASGHARPFGIWEQLARGRGKGRVRGDRAIRATSEAAAESDSSDSDADSDAAQSEQSQG